jgi:hypothetical protein
MNGEAFVTGKDGYEELTITGEMRGGSWQLREDTSLLETLRSRNIAYHLMGEAKYEWDGDEIFWHPGMGKPFESAANESGRVLDEPTYRQMRVKCLPVAEQVALLDGYIDEVKQQIAMRVAGDRARIKEGETPVHQHMIRIYRDSLRRHRRKRDRLLRDRPAPADLGALVRAHFDLDSAWRPSARWTVKLNREDVP